MQKFIVFLIVVIVIGGAVVYFTGSTEEVKGKMKGVASSVAAKSQGYKKDIAPEHKTLKADYESSQKATDKYAAAVRDALKLGQEAREEKTKLKTSLTAFKTANAKMNKLGYLHQDQYDFNKKRITELEAVVK